ncbi:late competence development ComFB family protein [Spirochaeta africana]|uniref:Late competence development protein ComFB n=1 Tax=Spirochaeta africana (strain ATCC 700263 / DSM 8902 / Z-7692) TaxID=889378 RepID=H9UJ27_SPIAZ|nr:late competence development ComFB family protein [Spirochaeta africana]AFG37520.1 Late competence development protein ComFB [Spirochaeta africana DSM 8902]
MKVRNILEDEVFRVIKEIADEDQCSSSPHFATTDQCRVDAACYVLNRLPPRYVSSGRGQAYADTEFSLNPQLEADILSLVHEGLRRVTTIRRAYYTGDASSQTDMPALAYHFPVIKGRLLHGLSFEPVGDVEIELHIDGSKAAMIDQNWQNPYPVASQTNGSYAFWPRISAADSADTVREFACELQVLGERYEPLRHHFTLCLHPRVTKPEDLFGGPDHRVPDMYLLPEA